MAGASSSSSSTARAAAEGLAATLAWMAASSALILANKRVFDVLPAPMLVTGVGQLASAAGGAALGVLLGRRPRSLPPAAWLFPTLSPLWAATFLTMWLGNAAYMHLSVAFIQVFKSMTPAVTLLLAAAAGQERASLGLALAVALIAAGTGSAAALEAGAPSWSSTGALLFIGSSVTEAARVVGCQRLMTVHHFNSLETLTYTSLPSGLALVAASLAFEPAARLLTLGLARGGLSGLAAALAPLAPLLGPAAALSFAVNLTAFWAIRGTGPLTFKVASVAKNLAVIWYALAVGRETLVAGQLAGYLASAGGFLLYAAAKSGGLAVVGGGAGAGAPPARKAKAA